MTKNFTMDDLPAEFKLCFRIIDAVVLDIQDYISSEGSLVSFRDRVSSHVRMVENHRSDSERSLGISRILENGHYLIGDTLRKWCRGYITVGKIQHSHALETACSLAKVLFTKAYIDGGGPLPSDDTIRLCVIQAALTHMMRALPSPLTMKFRHETKDHPGLSSLLVMQMTHLHTSSNYVQKGQIMTLENTSAGLVDLQTMIGELKRSMIDRAYAALGVRVVVSSKGKK